MEERKKPISNPPKKGMENGTWMILIGTTLFFDTLEAIISLIPVAGEIISMGISGIKYSTIWLVFKINGQEYSKNTMIGGAVIGFIPIINILPDGTTAVLKLYFDSKTKETLTNVPNEKLDKKTEIDKNKQNSKPIQKQQEENVEPAKPKQNIVQPPSIASDSNYPGYKTPDWMRDKSTDEVMKNPDEVSKKSYSQTKNGTGKIFVIHQNTGY